MTFRSTRFHRIAHALSDVHTRENILSHPSPRPQSLFLSPFLQNGEKRDPRLYILHSRVLTVLTVSPSFFSFSLSQFKYRAPGGFRFISRLSIRHLIYSVYRAPRCGWYASIITLWTAVRLWKEMYRTPVRVTCRNLNESVK